MKRVKYSLKLILKRKIVFSFIFFILILSTNILSAYNPLDTNWREHFSHKTMGPNSPVWVISVDSTGLFIGGSFKAECEICPILNSVAQWSDTTWISLGSNSFGANGPVRSLLKSSDNLYVGGIFDTAGTIPAHSIAFWNSSSNTWTALGEGVNGGVLSIAKSGNDLYVGGIFDTAGTSDAMNFAKWGSSSWTEVGNGVNGSISAIEISDQYIYIGGEFDTVGTVEAKNIARFNTNSSSWTPIGLGTNGEVYDFCFIGTDLYVVGIFDIVYNSSGTLSANGIAMWDDSSWSSLGNGLSGEVLAIATDSSNLYVGGNFTFAGSDTVNNIAKWDGSQWSSLGSGVGGLVRAIKYLNDSIYVGGDFFMTGDSISRFIGLWTVPEESQPVFPTNAERTDASKILVNQNYPNPFSRKTTIEFYLFNPSFISINVYNNLGIEVDNILNKFLDVGFHQVIWEGTEFENGNYFLQIKTYYDTKILKLLLIK